MVGCTKYSDGCKNCYAMPIAERLRDQGIKGYENGFKPTALPDKLDIPLSWKKPRLIFVNSMGDLFHDDIPLDFIKKVFDTIRRADWHVFTVLTKRSERLRELGPQLDWPQNLMIGVTIESDKYRNRLDYLKAVPAHMKYIVLEPLIAPVKRLDLTGIDWVIAGGESGANARPMNIEWIRNVRDWTIEQNKPFWFKQYSQNTEGKINSEGAILDGKIHKEFPEFKSGKPSLF